MILNSIFFAYMDMISQYDRRKSSYCALAFNYPFRSIISCSYFCQFLLMALNKAIFSRSFTTKRISESSWYNSIVSTILSNYCLLQL